MFDIVKLAAPGTLAAAALADDTVDVVIKVPARLIADTDSGGCEFLDAGLIQDMWTRAGRSDEELGLLLSVFSTAAQSMPMLATDYANWALHFGGCPNSVRDAVDQYFQRQAA